jgi:hypothetical protein
MKDFVIIIPFYKRHEITSLCFEYLQSQKERLKFFDVITCGSEGELSKELAESYGFKYVECANNPVSEKNNYLIQQTKGYKAVIILGSDDFLTDETLLSYKDLDLDTFDVYGFEYCHFYDVKSKGLYLFQSKGQTVGAGRVYTKKLLEAINYDLWSRPQNKGLDYLALKKAFAFGKEVIIKGDVLDVKHELNITSHEIKEMCETLDILEIEKFNVPKVLELQEATVKQIIMSKEKNKSAKLKVRILKDIYDYKEGQIIEVSRQLARYGVNCGEWDIVGKEVINDTIPNDKWSKEQLQAYCDENEIEYKKTLGVSKLLELINAK